MLRLSTVIIIIIVISDFVLTLVSKSMSNASKYESDTRKLSNYDMISSSCWNTNECLISASLEFYSGDIIPITVNCSIAEKVGDDLSINAKPRRRFENISSVTLDGCDAALNVNTFGFEYIPNCEKISTLNLKNFHFDEIYEIICVSGTALKHLRFEHNEFAGISAASIANLHTIETIHFENNNLRRVDEDAFSNLKFLREIFIIKEESLRLRYAKLFKNLIRLKKLYISTLNIISSNLLLNLPDSLEELTINDTAFDSETPIILTPPNLKNLTVTNCGLTDAIVKGNNMVLKLNLSSNLLNKFTLENCTHLEVLDLSSNNLSLLHQFQFAQLDHLDCVYLQRNKLKILSMSIFFSSLTHMQSIDVRGNELKHIDDITEALILNTNLRVFIDENPWNCKWLVNVSYNMPEQYRVFRYEKFISKINVNGLECKTYPVDMEPNASTGVRKNSTLFTIVYGAPRESKRNQKAEALVIVFMLPLGIAFLFVLLYLWIYCQKIFHLSFYRSLPIVRGSADRCDVVRQLPSQTNQGYEIPMTGCNCTDRCNKVCNKVHITYEEPPRQNAAKVYEDIIEYNTHTGNCFYDHLKEPQ